MTLVLLLIALLLVVACGVFVAAEFALLMVNRATIERMAARGDRRAQGVASALRTLSTQLSGAQVGITITNLAIGFLAQPAIAALIEPPLRAIGLHEAAIPGIALLLGVLIATVVTMLLGELVPKNLAIARPLQTAKLVQGAQRGFSAAMKWPIYLLNGSANFVLRRMGVEPQEELASARSADELASLVRRSADKGTLPPETALMLERSLIFDDLSASDVMTPRIRMQTIGTDETTADVVALARRTGLSRFPVTGRSQDDIVGIVHIKHAISVPAGRRGKTPVTQVMTKPLVVPSGTQLDTLLDQLRETSLHIAIVADEFGGTDGLVTMEDLLEELVGDVRGEHDRATGPSIRKRKEGVWAISGLLRPDEIAQQLGLMLPEDDEYETVGGLVADRLERIPVNDDSVELTVLDRKDRKHAVSLRVERMDGQRVDRLRLEILEPHADILIEENR